MQSVELKVGRNILKITEVDLILDNGCCYQIITKEIGFGFDKRPPLMSKKLFKELLKKEMIYTNDTLKEKAGRMYQTPNMVLYKFNVEKMLEEN